MIFLLFAVVMNRTSSSVVVRASSVRDWRGKLAVSALGGVASGRPACGHRAWRAGGHRRHDMQRARETVAEGCTASGGRRRHGMRRASAAIAEGSAVNLHDQSGELAASTVRARPARRASWRAGGRRGHTA
jgi:hypothetical protein